MIDNQTGEKIRANRFIGHPAYNGNLIINDFAGGEMSSPFTLNDYAQPIPLVNPSDTRPADRYVQGAFLHHFLSTIFGSGAYRRPHFFFQKSFIYRGNF